MGGSWGTLGDGRYGVVGMHGFALLPLAVGDGVRLPFVGVADGGGVWG